MKNVVLDASALLASLKNEPGAQVVEDALNVGVMMSSANWAEVLTVIADLGTPEDAADVDIELPVFVAPVDRRIALECACLRRTTGPFGLSLADRMCLATARVHDGVVMTADRQMAEAATALGDPEVQLIR